MTIYKFNKLSYTEQISTVEQVGAYIANRSEKGVSIHLFQLDAFYIELYYDENNYELVAMKSFTSTNKLRPYLEKIDLQKLLIGIE